MNERIKNKVIILLATFNRAHLIEKTLDSILAQTHANWECIIVDDFSRDNTCDVVKKYIQEDSRFTYYIKPSCYNKGLSASRNFGLKLAKQNPSEYIQFFDDDDIMHPQKLELQILSLDRNQKSKFSICGWSNFDNYEQIDWEQVWEIRPSKKFQIGESYLVGDIRFVAQVPLFRYDYAVNFIFDEDLFYAEEWALFSMRFLLDTPEFEVVREVLFYRRKHKASITESNDENFTIRKTRAVVETKVFDFLMENKIHTRITLFYFTRKFLLYSYDSKKIKAIKKSLRNSKNCTWFDYVRLNASILIHSTLRRIILKIMNF